MRALAAQATDVGTRLLNGTIDLDVARSYASIVKATAQLINAEVQRSKARREEPNLQLDALDA